ncbi:MAG: nuclear transport factor 2 family protein [Rhizobiales bacterium]|nr:nuclear transport factor 2 family protein [Hyphomicrobiales bacterium]
MTPGWIEVGGGRGYLAIPESGSGPGLMIFAGSGRGRDFTALADLYAEEGYVTLAVEGGAVDAAKALATCREVTGQVGAIGFGSGAADAVSAVKAGAAACAIAYGGEAIAAALAGPRHGRPVMVHLADPDGATFEALRPQFPAVEAFHYRGAAPGFAEAGETFDKSAFNLAYTRSLEMLRRVLGPRYDLDKIWDRHTELEFATRAAEETMTTMVAEPYVNHVPVMTGGTGYDETLRFYKHHFIPPAPQDARLVPISRTVGADRVVDEMLFCFTHDNEIDWMLPGVKPTGRRVEIPLVAIVRFRGDKIYSEHIYWDQASVLVQVGLLDQKLYPTAGIETARKAFDETEPSNTIMARWKESEER